MGTKKEGFEHMRKVRTDLRPLSLGQYMRNKANLSANLPMYGGVFTLFRKERSLESGFRPHEKRVPIYLLTSIVLTMGLILFLNTFVFAHDYWYEMNGQDYVLYRGHHLTEHEGEEIVPYDPSIVKNALCVRDGIVQEVDPLSQYPVSIPGPCEALAVEVDSGYWTQTWTETLNLPKDQVSEALYSWRALENTKLVNSWRNSQAGTPLSRGLEILLERNPFVLEVGQKLRLVVMQAGKPREGVTVAYDGKPRGVTGKDGRINIRIRHGGLQLLTGSVDESSPDNDKADKLIRATALFFVLPEEH